MTREDGPAFTRALRRLEDYFHGLDQAGVKRLSDEQSEAYLAGLMDLPIDAIEAACVEALRRCKWFPRVSELRDFAHGSEDDQANLAWTALERACRRGGSRSVVAEDGCWAWAVELTFGSWVDAVAACLPGDPSWLSRRKDFTAAIRSARRRMVDPWPRLLAGRDEVQARERDRPWSSMAGAVDPTVVVLVVSYGGDLPRPVRASIDGRRALTQDAQTIATLPTWEPVRLPAPPSVDERELSPAEARAAVEAVMAKVIERLPAEAREGATPAGMMAGLMAAKTMPGGD